MPICKRKHTPALLVLTPLLVLATACSPKSTAPTEADFKRAETLMPTEPQLAERWVRSCQLCHAVRGPAPLAGHFPSWQRRLAQGPEVLLAHARNGFNAMPPMGLCNDCSDEDLRRLIDFMSREP